GREIAQDEKGQGKEGRGDKGGTARGTLEQATSIRRHRTGKSASADIEVPLGNCGAGEMNDVALESWIESIPTVKFRARRVKLGILLIVAFPLFGLYSQGIWSYVAYGLDLALLLFLIHRRLSASRLEGTEPLDRSDPAFREIVEDVEDVQRKIGLSDQAIVLRVDKAGFSTSPSVQSVPRSHKSRVQ